MSNIQIAPDAVHCVLDTETTGTSIAEDRVIEIGVVKVVGFNAVDERRWLINPMRDIPAEATRVHGITDTMVRDAPSFEEIAEAFLDFIGDAILVAHNAEFDMRFLNHELGLIARRPLRNPVKDTLAMARRQFPGSPGSLDALARRFRIDNTRKEESGRHGALIDAAMLVRIWIELEGGRQSSLFSGSEPDAAPELPDGAGPAVVAASRRVIRASEEERAAHAAFLAAQVKNAIWSRL